MPRPIALLALLLAACPLSAADVAERDEMGRDYYVYAPPRVDPNKTYWLVVGVHGYGGDGRGAAGLAEWARKGDCVVVGPSFPNEGYQLLQKEADEQLVKLFAALGRRFKLHPKLFVYGFSGGAQFAHRFMMKRPELVAGCSAHSGGSWATGEQWGSINPAAAGVPLVMSCGEADTDKKHPAAPMGRFEWAKAFDAQLAAAGFCYEAKYWPKVAHAASPGVATMTEECYRLATRVVPQREGTVATIRKLAAGGKKDAALAAIRGAKTALPKKAVGLDKALADRHAKELDALAAEVTAGK